MAPLDRIRELSAQLVRAENPIVFQMVLDQLKAAIDAYMVNVQGEFPVIEVTTLGGQEGLN